MNTIENIKERYQQLQSANGKSVLGAMEQNAFDAFTKLGVPTVKHEEWKYTRISSVFNKNFDLAPAILQSSFSATDLKDVRLPGSDAANEIFFVNGIFNTSLSTIRSAGISISSLEDAAKNGDHILLSHLGFTGKYVQDGIHALNTAFAQEGVFITVAAKQIIEHPVYVYHITDARSQNILSQPRTLLHIGEAAQLQLVETNVTLGLSESFTNHIMEVVVEKDAVVEYYKIQNDAAHTNQVSTTGFRQIGKSVVHTVTISLNGGIVRNNLVVALEAERSEAHLYGLYFPKGETHVDNHTVVDNVEPHCESNELYKGVADDHGVAVFNGKIFVRQKAQKTNAFQSNKNILLSENASVNTKPQLEIFADDVKCSHGCTVGQLDEEALFYLRSRGVTEQMALSLLVHAFAIDILDRIKLEPVREYVNGLLAERLQFNNE